MAKRGRVKRHTIWYEDTLTQRAVSVWDGDILQVLWRGRLVTVGHVLYDALTCGAQTQSFGFVCRALISSIPLAGAREICTDEDLTDLHIKRSEGRMLWILHVPVGL